MIPVGDQKETLTIEAEDKAGNKSLCRITINAKGTHLEGSADTSDPTSMGYITFLLLLVLSSGTMAVIILRRKHWIK